MDEMAKKLEALTGRPVERIELPVHEVAFTGYPLFLYRYRMDGYHHGGEPINTEWELSEYFANDHAHDLNDGREVRITDANDFLVYWIQHGQVKHDGLGRTG